MKIWQLTEATIDDIKRKVQTALAMLSSNKPTVNTDSPAGLSGTTDVTGSSGMSTSSQDAKVDTSGPSKLGGGNMDKGISVDTSSVKVQDQKFHASGKYYIKKINGRNFIIDPEGNVNTGVFGNKGGFSDASIPQAEKTIIRLNQTTSKEAPVAVPTGETADSIKAWARDGISSDSVGAPGQILNKIRDYMKKGMPMRAIMLVQRNAKIVTDKYFEPGEKDAIMKAATAQKSKLGL